MRPIRPETLRRWRELRAWAEKEFQRAWKFPRAVCPEMSHFSPRWLRAVTKTRYDWARGHGDTLYTASWAAEGYTFVANRRFDMDSGIDDFLGEFTSSPRETGRHAWKSGVYDRGHGQPMRGQFRYIQLSDWDYESVRKSYSAAGHSRYYADLLARLDFARRVKEMETWGEGQLDVEWVEVKVFDEDGVEFGSASLCGIQIADDEIPGVCYIDEVTSDLAAEALADARKYEAKLKARYGQLPLPGVSA